MNRFQPSTRRAAFGLVAAALTALTFGLTVVAPARMDSGTAEVSPLAGGKVLAPAATEVTTAPLRIEVIGTRNSELASARTPVGEARCATQG